MTIAYNPLSGNLELKEPGPQGPAGVVSAAGPGSQGTPSISFAADLDTGLYNYTPNGLAISTNGTGRLFVDASGRVGVNTASPNDSLQINKNATNASNAGLTFKSADSNESLLSIGVSTSLGKACITSTQNGTGTVLPIAFVVGLSSTDERMRIDNSGRLLVGTSSSSATGTIFAQGSNSSATGPSYLYLQRGQAAGASISTGTSLGIINFGDSASAVFAQIAAEGDAPSGAGDYPGRLVFSTTADGASSPTERMRISADGTVDIAGDLVFGPNSAPAVKSDTTGVTGADQITNMMSLTQAEYDAIGTPDTNTFYVITA